MSLQSFLTGIGSSLGTAAGNIGQNIASNAGNYALGGAGLLAIKEAYDKLGDIGVEAQESALGIAQEGLEQTAFQPYGVTSATGSTFGYDPETGAATMGLSPQEQALQSMLMSQAKTTLGATPYGQEAGRTAAEQAYLLGGDFMRSAGMPTDEREADVYERIRAAQRPEEERRALALEERLQNQGRLGVRTSMFGGTPEQLAMSKAQAEAQNTAMLGAMQQAQAEQRQQAQLGQAFTGMGSQLSAQDLAMLSGQQQLGLGALGGSYIPQSQLLAAMQGSELYPQLQQRGQLYGAGLFGEGAMGGVEALLGASLGQADLMGVLGTGLLSGALS